MTPRWNVTVRGPSETSAIHVMVMLWQGQGVLLSLAKIIGQLPLLTTYLTSEEKGPNQPSGCGEPQISDVGVIRCNSL